MRAIACASISPKFMARRYRRFIYFLETVGASSLWETEVTLESFSLISQPTRTTHIPAWLRERISEHAEEAYRRPTILIPKLVEAGSWNQTYRLFPGSILKLRFCLPLGPVRPMSPNHASALCFVIFYGSLVISSRNRSRRALKEQALQQERLQWVHHRYLVVIPKTLIFIDQSLRTVRQ